MLGCLCCAGSSFCNTCCAGCNRLGVASKNYAKVSYIIMAMVVMTISLIIMYSLRPLAEKYDWQYCEYKIIGNDDCFGQISVLRMSFSLTVFHLLMLIILIPRAAVCGAIHDGFWPIKYIILLGIYVGAWFIPKTFFSVWGHICRVGSIFYLFVQAYFIMNLAYLWNDYLISAIQGRNGESWAKFLLILVSVVSTAGSIVWLVFCYKWFWGCAGSNFILIETSVFILWFYMAAILRLFNIVLRENYTIFVCSMVVPYLVFICWTTLASNVTDKCNDLASSKANTAL